jgi:hypothetical protein
MYKIILCLILLLLNSFSFASPITPDGQMLSSFLDSMDVANHWLGGQHVNWMTGEPNGKTRGAINSHCSAFVSAAAVRLNIYILRPPAHKQNLLANAQYNWLINQGAQFGWFAVGDGNQAQQIANLGCFVVAVFQNPDANKPGHIAIIRPSDKDKNTIDSEGPQLIQAGRENYNSIPLLQGFRHHISYAKDSTIIYYGHNTTWCQYHAE